MASASTVSANAASNTTPRSDEKNTRADGVPEQSPISTSRPPSSAQSSRNDLPDGSDAATIHTTDGRVKNPVPSKLKGKADNKNGNFGVMHIDINSSQAALRNAAAKRTSEETEAAAKLANLRGYQSIKRSKLAWNPQLDMDQQLSTPLPKAVQNTYLQLARSSSVIPAGPSPQETKVEQARLLTLLRSLHPVVVVDQLCKALAYFGGIPGAPPANDSTFPNSAKSNGHGSLFIGWVSEIFPPVEGSPSTIPPQPSTQYIPPSAPTNRYAPTTTTTPSTPTSIIAPTPSSAPATTAGSADTSVALSIPAKRPRGRPKGSKTKTRGDKEDGKASPASAAFARAVDPSNSNSQNANSSPREEHSVSQAAELRRENEQSQNTSATISSHGVETNSYGHPDSSIISTPGKGKKRGRPKGSKNRPRSVPDSSQPTTDLPGPALSTSVDSNQASQSPLSQKASSNPAATGSLQKVSNSETDEQQPDTTPQQLASVGSKQLQSSQATSAVAPNSWTRTRMPPTDTVHQSPNTGNQSLTMKRKAGDTPQTTNTDTSNMTTSVASTLQVQSKPNSHHPPERTNVKRRRIFPGSLQNSNFNQTNSQSPPMGMATSPVMSNAFNDVSQPINSSSYNPQMPAGARSNSNKPYQQHHQQQHMQNRPSPSQYSPQNPPQTTAGMGVTLQNQHSQMAPLGSANTPASSSIHNSPQGHMVSPGYYAPQRQISSRMAHVANASGTFNHSGNQFSSNMARQTPNDSNITRLSQNAAVPNSRNQQGHAASRQPSDLAGQQVPSTSGPPSSLAQFSSFGDQGYLDMDYGLNDRDVQDAAVAFGDSSQLDAVLEPNIRQRLYHQAMHNRP